MTAEHLTTMLRLSDLPTRLLEIGFFDGEGHWCKIEGFRLTEVDEADWKPLPGEKQTGAMRPVIELTDYVD